MRIINNSGNPMTYVVTPSGTTLENSDVVASGYVPQNTAVEFEVENAGRRPLVYLKPYEDNGNEGYAFRQVIDSDSTVSIAIDGD